MDCKIIMDLPYTLTMEILNEELNLRNKKNLLSMVEPLLKKTLELAHPKAIYFKAEVKAKNDKSVSINDNVFESQLLISHVKKGEPVYPYIVTVGTELDAYAKSLTGAMDQLMIDGIMDLLVNIGKVTVANAVQKEATWTEIQDYVPGNGEEWSAEEQTCLFQMFGNESQEIGVTLGAHAFVLPGRSTIGILSEKK